MNIKESIHSALSSVLSNKMRSILTMIGIIIGIGSVILITSVGGGANKMITDEFNKLGYQGIQIYAAYDYTGSINMDKIELKKDDVTTIEKNNAINSVSVVGNANGSIDIKNQNDNELISITATDQNYTDVRAIELVSGRFLHENDNKRLSRVVVIDENISKLAFGRTNTIGETISITIDQNDIDYTIVGITKSEGESGEMSFLGSRSTAFIPFDTLIDVTGKEQTLFLLAKLKDGYNINETAREIKKILAITHGTDSDKYVVEDIMASVAMISTVFTGITAFISFVAGISLLVGGVGVMNIMLVTVTERTREIGIRKSLGATNANIQFQFLIESVILTAIGGTIGVIIGYFGGMAVGAIVGITPVVSIPIIILVVVISSLIGIVFGVYPANKAANLDPIDALRYE